LESGKDNLILTLAPQAMVEESDIHDLLVPLYEHLKDINRGAISLRNERVCICVARALGNIASEMVKLKSRAFRGHRSPLACMPLGYLKVCAESAQNEGLSDVAFQGSEALTGVALAAPSNINPGDVHLPIIEGLYRFANNFLISGRWQLVNEPLKSMMEMAHHLLEQKHYQLHLILKDMLQKVELLAPLAVSYEKKNPSSSATGLPLASAYDLGNPMSIGYLVARASEVLIDQEENKEWINPYRKFIQLNEMVYSHFRNLAEKVDLGTSFLLWHITKTIRHISKVYQWLLVNPVTNDDRHINELLKQIPWYLAFFWVAFARATNITYYYAREACDTLAWIGMSFLDAGYREVTEACISNITSIAESYHEVSKRIRKKVALGEVTELFEFLWYIRLLAYFRDDRTIIRKAEESLEKLESLLPEEEWSFIEQELETRKRRLDNKLREAYPSRLIDLHTAWGLLVILLKK